MPKKIIKTDKDGKVSVTSTPLASEKAQRELGEVAAQEAWAPKDKPAAAKTSASKKVTADEK